MLIQLPLDTITRTECGNDFLLFGFEYGKRKQGGSRGIEGIYNIQSGQENSIVSGMIKGMVKARGAFLGIELREIRRLFY